MEALLIELMASLEEKEVAGDMASVEEQVNKTIGEMIQRLDALEGVMVVDSDGFVVASAGPITRQYKELELVGGMVTSLSGVIQRLAQELDTGQVSRLMIYGERRHIFGCRIGTSMNLVVVAMAGAPLGLIFAEMKRYSELLAEIIGVW